MSDEETPPADAPGPQPTPPTLTGPTVEPGHRPEVDPAQVQQELEPAQQTLEPVAPFEYPDIGYAEIREGVDPNYGAPQIREPEIEAPQIEVQDAE